IIPTKDGKFFAVATAIPDTPTTPLNTFVKGSGDAAGYAVKVTKVVVSPQITGDTPNNGMQYLEVDLTITNSGNTTDVVPGAFLFRSSSGLIYSTADAEGNLPD